MSMIPWKTIVRTAVALGIRPSDLWALAVREWTALFANDTGLTRRDFDTLHADHPDVAPKVTPLAERDVPQPADTVHANEE